MRCTIAMAIALALVGCKDDPPPTPAAAPDAAPSGPDAAAPDTAVPDAGPVDEGTSDAMELTGAVTVLKFDVPKPGGGAAAPKNRPRPTPAATSIMGTIKKHQNEVVDCYAGVAEAKPDVAGQLTVRWTLGADGKPTMASIAKDTMGDPAVAACVKRRSMKWQFPRPSGGTSVVKYTWNLRMQ